MNTYVGSSIKFLIIFNCEMVTLSYDGKDILDNLFNKLFNNT